jgi:hypothetical protein
VNDVRSLPVEVDFLNIPIANTWATREGEAGSIFQLRLASNDISIEHATGDLWTVSLEVIKWEP